MLSARVAHNPPPATVEERRRAFQDLMRLAARDVPLSGIENIAIPGPGGSTPIRLYTPHEIGADAMPAMVYLHGGGFLSGSLDTHEMLCHTLAHETAMRVVSVGYRLAPEHKFPAALMDGLAALRWMADHAGELKTDPLRIGIGGDSAGGTLAAVISRMARGMQGPEVAFQLLICPIVDFAAETPSRRAFAGPLLDSATLDHDLACYLPVGVSREDSRVSPLRASDFTGLPRAFIHTAECDPLCDEGRSYADALACAGIEVHHSCHQGLPHLFYGMTGVIPSARTALQRIGAELKAALARPGEGP
jgi:acetyl esterase/lipase